MQWFRFYSGALDDPKVQRLPGDLFKVWINLLCLANESEQRGVLPSREDIAFRLRLDDQKAEDALRGLVRAGLLDEGDDDTLQIHGWEGRQKKSDDVTERVQRHRNKGNEPETLQKRSGNALDKSRVEESKTREEQTRVEEMPRAAPPPPRPITPAPRRANARPTLPSVEALVEQLRSWADAKGVRDILQDEVERFHDYCLSGKNGRPVEYADYAAGCRKWITNPSFEHKAASRASPPMVVNGTAIPPNSRTARNIRVLQDADW